MATLFMEPGGDATYDFSLWPVSTGATIATDFVHGTHVKSFKVAKDGSQAYARFNTASLTGRLSCYVYFNALPGAAARFIDIYRSATGVGVDLRITSAGVLQLFDSFTPAQLGSNGATLSTGTWYRITICWNITSTTVNEFRVYVDGGAASISVTNGTIVGGTVNNIRFGNSSGDTTLDHRFSDIYIDDSSSANDIATDVWVTAKRPVSNGTANNFTSQIGAGGSGYGSGHSPQVNERALSQTNGWSMIGAGSAVTEEYTVEAAAVGDLTVGTIIDYMGWVWADSGAGSETASIKVGGTSSNIALTGTPTAFRAAKGSTTYPAGGTDIGIVTTTALLTVSLYECGLMFAYTPITVIPASITGVLGAVDVAGNAGAVTAQNVKSITGVLGAVSIAGNAGVVATVRNASITGVNGSIGVDGNAGAVVTLRIASITGVLGSVSIAGNAGAVEAQNDKEITGVVGAISVDGNAGAVQTVRIVSVTGVNGSVSVDGNAGVVEAQNDKDITGALGTISVSGNAGEVHIGRDITGVLGTISVDGHAGVVEAHNVASITGVNGSISVSGNAGTVAANNIAAIIGVLGLITVLGHEGFLRSPSSRAPGPGGSATVASYGPGGSGTVASRGPGGSATVAARGPGGGATVASRGPNGTATIERGPGGSGKVTL